MNHDAIPHDVEFFGGPLDGLRQRMLIPATTFLGIVRQPVEEPSSLVQQFSAQRQSERQLPVAIYEMQVCEGDYRYQHVATELVVCNPERGPVSLRTIRTPNR